jgi:hypothetical protein
MMIEKTRFVNTLIRNQNHLEQPSGMASHLNSPSAHEASCGNASGFLVTYCLFNKKIHSSAHSFPKKFTTMLIFSSD